MPQHYTKIAIFLHWLIALSLVGLVAVGFYMEDLPQTAPGKYPLYQLHKSVGITVLLLSLVRLVWRLTHKAPPLPAHMPRWEKAAAQATHVAFYVLMLGLPLTGWSMVSSSPLQIPTLLYGVVPWPHLPLGVNGDLSHDFAEVHENLVLILIALVLLHVAAALRHHFILKDGLLKRMLPFLKTLLLACLIASPASAKVWQVDYEKSTLTFSGKASGAVFTGAFKTFTATIDFDPAAPEGGKILVDVAMASAATGAADKDAQLPQESWFHAAMFPKATFQSESISKVGENQYVAKGPLTIKGLAKQVNIPFTLTPQADGSTQAQGTLTLSRTDYKVGNGGMWADESTVAFPVDVRFAIVAR